MKINFNDLEKYDDDLPEYRKKESKDRVKMKKNKKPNTDKPQQ
jgi:hypothetical protein